MRKRSSLACAVSLCAALPLALCAQTSRGPDVPSSSTPTSVGPKIAGDSSDFLYELDPDFRQRMLLSRREEMKKRLMANASRLLEMTKQLDSDLQGHEPTKADAKRLDDIAKLARVVRDQMRQ